MQQSKAFLSVLLLDHHACQLVVSVVGFLRNQDVVLQLS